MTQAAFPALAQPAAGTPTLARGQRILRYATNHSAEVALPGGGKGLIESTAPIATTVGHRHLPLDLRLTEAGDLFAPARSDVQVRVPRQLEDGGVSLSSAGVSLTPVDPHGAPLPGSSGRLDGAAVLWRHADRKGALDLASAAKLTAGGVDLSTMLLSQRSSGNLYFRLGLPAGAHAVRTAGGYLQILSYKALLAKVAPVSAEDAEGTSVPVAMSLHGNTLHVSVDLTGDYLYPIAVDPELLAPPDSKLGDLASHAGNWEFKTTSLANFQKSTGVESLETKGIGNYNPPGHEEDALWAYQTKGVSRIYEVKTQTSGHNKGHKIESFLALLEPSGAAETKKVLSNEAENPEYENKATTICAANASKVEECLPGSGKANNAVVFEQAATGNPGSSFGFSDSITQGIVSIAEPSGTHSTTSYNTSSSTIEVEVEGLAGKEKVKRVNALLNGANTWLAKLSGAAGGAIELKAADPGIGVSATKLEYESAAGVWTPLEEHNYLTENGCQGVQCYVTHNEAWMLTPTLPDGAQKLRYRAQEAISGTESLTSEGTATVKVDTKKPHGLTIAGLPGDGELSERPYEMTVFARDGEGSTVASSGVKSIAMFVDGKEIGTAGGSCTVAKGECTTSNKFTVNGAELGAGKHGLVVVALDNAGNEARYEQRVAIRHSTPVTLGPGSVDLQSGDFALGASDVSMGSGLTIGRNYSSRDTNAGGAAPLGPEWTLNVGNAEGLEELPTGDVLLADSSGKQTIFAALGEGKFESPPGDANLELTLEENKTTKEKLAYYLKNPAAHTSVKFTRPAGTKQWVPTVQEGAVSSDTVTYKYATTPAFTEYQVPDGPSAFTEGAVGGPDGNVWFVEHSGNRIGKITPTGSTKTYATAAGAEPRRITTGPDGNLWFSENAKKVGRITPSGKITEFPTLKAESLAIATGPNGWIWFSEGVEHRISEINPSKTNEEFTRVTLPVGTTAGEMAIGPDGNMWVVLKSSSSSKIAKVPPSGAITEYALPAGSNAVAITAGPSNSMWFTNVGTKKIGKITMTGAITEYATPEKTGGTPIAIAKGPDGNLWFTSQKYIGKMTPTGEVSEYPTYLAEGEEFITAGADGNMWFLNRNFIGAIAPPGEIAIPVEVRAPAPAGVSCSYTSKPTEMSPGCRALRIEYLQDIGFEHIWRILLVAYNPVSKTMTETPVEEYEYDAQKRLVAARDPRLGGNLTTTYGYDEEGHVTAMSPPGQEPWTFTYGAVAGDKGTGRLLKAARAPASTELWKGTAVANTVAPAVSGAATEGVRLAVSQGTWSGGPISYGYQWKRCQASGACEPIAGATNPNYTPGASDVGDTLLAEVTATNAGGSLKVASAATAAVVTPESLWTEYALPESSGPRGVAAGPASNAMWFTENTSNKIGKTTTAGAITEYALPSGSGPEGIAKGPDENMWFTDYTSNKIGKITSTGTITEYALPAESHPRSIAPGPDGKLWFTDFSTNKIGKITTAGVITEYALPPGSLPTGIVAGPDGNLWFTDSSTNKIGKITTAGVITEYALPVNSGPIGIVAGPDGNLWFTDSATKKIGKITTAGTITEYTSGSFPEYITSAGGYLWATSKKGWILSKITTAGAIAEFKMPSGPLGLAANSLGELWYATTNKIGKLLMGSVTAGEAKSPEPGSTLAYNVPVIGSTAPHNMSGGEVAKWGQVDDPVEATAIFPPDEPQGWPASGYKRATIHYLDERGREVNVAAPSTDPNGAIATTEYNEFNDVIRTLSPDNRLTALAAGAGSAEKSKLLDTQNTYNGEGKKESEVEEAGTRLIDALGPQHTIKYRAGGETKESLARHHEVLVYDQGAPGGEKYSLVTEKYDLAQLVNHEEVEVRTTKTSYSGQGNLGWKLRAPTSVTVDPEGFKQTATTEYEPTTGQITEVRGAGAETTLSYASKFGETGTETGKLKNPWGVAVNSEGKLWVVDSANNRVEEFSSSGGYLTKFGEPGSGPGQLSGPEGIALDSAGHIWVADTGNNRIEEFSATGAYMATVGSLGTESGKFKAPAALAFDPKGNMWVADSGNSRVEKFDKEAKYVSEFGSAGAEPGKLAEPKGIAVDSGEHIWIADTGNNRIQEFSTTGSLLKRFGTPGAGEGQLNAPIDLKIDSLGNIWTVDSNNNRAESFSPGGALVTQIGFKGTEPGQLTGPHSLAFDATGKAWVSDSSNNRLEQWSKGPNAHDHKTIYYSKAANSEYPTCGGHPEWAGLICETLPAKQPELMSLPKLPVTVTTYNMYNEPETISETFGSTTRTKKESYDSGGRKTSSEVTASTGVSLPKVNFTYSSTMGMLEQETTEGEGKTLSSEFNRLGQLIKYTDADGNVAKYKYAGAENDFLVEEASDSSASGTSRQTYEYDSTTKLRTKLIDSAAGSFTASYDPEGELTSVSYPYGMCSNYAYNTVGEATSVQYTKSSNCSESEPALWYSDSRSPSIRGEMLSQASTLATEGYIYDSLGRLTEAQETPSGEGCTVRAYAFDEQSNRASSNTRAPGGGGACQAEGGTIEAHNYDESGRLADGGMAYDGLGNITKLPAADAEGKELTSSFYVDNAVASQTQGGVTNEYKLDPEGRTRETITGSTKTKSHYDGPGETPAWTESAEAWTRNIPGIDGTLVATQTNGATPVIQLHDLQGDVVATIGDKAGEAKLLSTYNSTEFGVPNGGKAPPKFAWLGAVGVESSFSTGVVTYGATSYVPQTGRALQSEQVAAPGRGGGSGLGAPYMMQEEPWVMQGAGRLAAEAPGLEAAREQAAFEAAEGTFVDPWVHHEMNRSKAASLAEEYWEAEAFAVVAAMNDIPTDAVEALGQKFGDFLADFTDAYKWMYDAGAMLNKCANNKRKVNGRAVNICWFEYEQIEWTPGVNIFGVDIKAPLTLKFPNFSVEPRVNECIYVQGPSLVCVANVYIDSEL